MTDTFKRVLDFFLLPVNEFLRAITSHCEDLSRVIVAMESTGCYHINLYSFLTSQEIRTMVINPLLIANYAKLSLRKTKTDKKDARTIAKFLLDHRQEISQLCVSQDLNLFLDILKHFIYFLYLSCLHKELDAEA